MAKKPFKKIVSPLEFNKTKIKAEWMDPIAAQIRKGDVVGNIYITIPGKKAVKEDLIAAKNINKMSSLVRVKSILKFLLYGDIIDK